MTLPVRIPLKMAMASECDRPDVERPFTERISSPAERMRIPDQRKFVGIYCTRDRIVHEIVPDCTQSYRRGS